MNSVKLEQWTEGPKSTKNKLNLMTSAINELIDETGNGAKKVNTTFDVCVNGVACQFEIAAYLKLVGE